MEFETLILALSLVLSVISIAISAFTVVFTRKQANQAEQQVLISAEISRSEAVSHFTDRFFDLLKEVKQGSVAQQIVDDPGWAYQFWSLESTEFYFFHHGVLPLFMYSLWMIDLADLYAGESGQSIRASHAAYLDRYALNYNEMCEFFDHIYQLSKSHNNASIRNREIANWVAGWLQTNKKVSFK